MAASPPLARGITQIEASSVHRITSGQVVVDLQTALKELVENALDAGATTIDVRLKNNGVDAFEVSDNGSGVDSSNIPSLALKHHTSKLASFADLSAVTSFGFRGEALSSLCALSESVEITTATQQDAPVGTVVTFDRTGRVLDASARTARPRGTTVRVSGLFVPVPVRRRELEKNARREFGKVLSLLTAYALVPASANRGVRLGVSSTSQAGKHTKHLLTTGAPSIKASISSVWGPKALDNLVSFSFNVSLDDSASPFDTSGTPFAKIVGVISSASVGCGRASSDRQFFYINGRPCVLVKIQKVVNETYRSINPVQLPMIILDLKLPTKTCDINVSPDKRTILLHHEQYLMQKLREHLEGLLSPAQSIYAVSEPARSLSQRIFGVQTPEVLDLPDKPSLALTAPTMPYSRPLAPSPPRARRISAASSAVGAAEPEPRSRPPVTQLKQLRTMSSSVTRSSGSAVVGKSTDYLDRQNSTNRRCSSPSSSPEDAISYLSTPKRPNPSLDSADDLLTSIGGSVASSRRENITVSFDQTDLRYPSLSAPQFRSPRSPLTSDRTPQPALASIYNQDLKGAESELQRIIKKTDFARMKIVGQYNLGFIVARKTTPTGDDLFIIDQHAADEKFNFETLQLNTRIQSQRLIQPRPLELAASDVVLVTDHADILRQNGFDVVVSSDDSVTADKAGKFGDHATTRVSLVAQPISKETVFDFQDLQELIHLMQDNPAGGMVRCSKARSMFAMRACRKSVMIGRALSRAQMQQVVANLSTIDQPWNCPHGRPTMRHLTTLGGAKPQRGRALDWSKV